MVNPITRATAAALLIAASTVAQADWTLDAGESRLSFISTKNASKAEVHYFREISGAVTDILNSVRGESGNDGSVHDLARLEVNPGVQRAYNDRMQGELAQTVWAADCDSWYKDAEGRISNNWPRSTAAYWWHMRAPDFADFDMA